VCNYFPIHLPDGSWSAPFELAHKIKPDLRVLFKMFGLAAVRRERSGNLHPNKFEPQSVPTSHATVGLRRYSAGHTYK